MAKRDAAVSTWPQTCIAITGVPGTNTVLILHEDLGFAFWLSRILDTGGFMALPAKSVAGARALLNQINACIEGLVVDASVAGAAALAWELCNTQHQLGVVAVGDGNQCYPPLPCAVTVRKPRYFDEISRIEWLEVVETACLPSTPGECNQCSWLRQEATGTTQFYIDALRRFHAARINGDRALVKMLQPGVAAASKAYEAAKYAYRAHAGLHRAAILVTSPVRTASTAGPSAPGLWSAERGLTTRV